ncbi:arylsulfatase [Anaerorudis cellulosivorans]|uniref:arylsulfatase n=1 Tax=Anaerorudis cellulosivorans TaxID=3397862 RepID=UPI002220E605|nr:arylsulfatase [Seramator thermalis]MCW1735461.1 arylsulfatase [Seramator thermalis]
MNEIEIQFIKSLGTAVITGVTFLSVSSCNEKQEKTRLPNIIYIMADDLGYNDLGCYGAPRIQTPNIDRMAADGICFTQHYAGTSVCAPSRSSLMTGQHTGNPHVSGNMQWEPYGKFPLPENTTTVAFLLKETGYKTTLIGKWGLGVEGTSGDPLKQGFDSYYGYLCQVLAHNHAPEYLMENGEKVYLDNKVVWTDTSHWTKGLGSYSIEINQFSQELFTKRALKFIEENRNDPFFLYFSVIIPHDNGEAPEGKRYSDIPSFEPYDDKDWTESEKGYAAMITYLDKDVEIILDKLKELGIDENTLVIFTSDNGGDSPGSFYTESNQPFRGHKRDLYEGGIRVPFIARGTGKIEPGTQTGHVSAFWDFMPTVCELAGIEIPDITDGISYLPAMLGQPQQKHDHLYFEFHEQGGKQAVIKENWELIRFDVKNPEKTRVELYNLEIDIGEQNNLTEQMPEKVAELLPLFSQDHTESPWFTFIP